MSSLASSPAETAPTPCSGGRLPSPPAGPSSAFLFLQPTCGPPSFFSYREPTIASICLPLDCFHPPLKALPFWSGRSKASSAPLYTPLRIGSGGSGRPPVVDDTGFLFHLDFERVKAGAASIGVSPRVGVSLSQRRSSASALRPHSRKPSRRARRPVHDPPFSAPKRVYAFKDFIS